jgi:hypothetical protein
MNPQQEKQLLDVHTQQATLTQVVTDNIQLTSKIIQKHDDILLGTSQSDPGLVTRVDREEQKSKNITRLIWIVVTGAVGTGVTLAAAAIF